MTRRKIPITTTSKKNYNILYHDLVPEHTVLSEQESNELLKRYDIKIDQLPKIISTDPAAISIGAKPGQIIKIKRKSRTALSAIAYRLVVESESGSKISATKLQAKKKKNKEQEKKNKK